MALRLGWELRGTATLATDASLLRARRLVEVAASANGVRQSQLSRIAPGARVRRVPRDAEKDSTANRSGVLRRLENQQPVAVALATIQSGTDLELATIPAETRLDEAWLLLAGWWLLGAGGLAFSLWASAARRDARRFKDTMTAWSFLGPAMLHLAIFSFAPVAFALYLAFHRWGLVEATRPFVGLDNFRTVFRDARFWHSLGVTAMYALYVPVSMLLALAAAVALDRSGIRVRILRTILFLPFISSVVAVALVWQWLYQPDFGLLNTGLHLLGWTGPDWLGNTRTALGAVMLMSVWVQLGYQMVIFLGGLQGIPVTYHDAARVDGAGPLARLRWITLPLLRPTLLFVLVTGTINSFQVFTYISVMTEGGPLLSTDVVVYRIYQEAWEFLRFGTASAMSLTLLALLLALTWAQFRWLGRRVDMV
jgi:ABC-type sugar transport system permease subunit